MKIFKTPASLQHWRETIAPTAKVGFVPTMGALHEGHLSLIKQSQRENQITVVSIFVNPTQFGPKEDFKKYPRPWRHDHQKLRSLNLKFLFSPSAEAMYLSNDKTRIHVEGLSSQLCGAPPFRGAAHFDGVATVVAKLFHLVRPFRAYFGLKDFQQVRVIETMVENLNFPIKIIRCPTYREPDGLAMSSRNTYLSPHERALAPRLYAALQYGRKLLTSRPKMNPQAVCQQVKDLLASTPEFKIEYIELVDQKTLLRATSSQKTRVMAAAVRLGSTRLIDNILVK